MSTLEIIVKPKLKFSLKKCGDIVPYGITPEERAKLAGIEENANDYTHPETHPASILDVVDVVNGDANKFLNERGEMVATSSIGVTGSQLYASTEDSDVDGYKSLAETPQALETEIILTAKSSDGIVWGAKYLSAPFTEAVTIPTTAYGFDYWRKVSASNGTSRKHLRVFLYRAGVETNIITPLASPDIDDTEFTERQISYIFPELVLLAGDRIGIQEGFSTTHANNITLTYIVGDGRGWFMRLPLPLKHENLTDKNSEATFQHVDTTVTKNTLDAADMVAIKDSVTGEVVLTPKTQFAMTEQEGWIIPTFLNNFSPIGPNQCSFYKNSIGEVKIQGWIKSSALVYGTIFVLPVGYRPQFTLVFPQASMDSVNTVIYVQADGIVKYNKGAIQGQSLTWCSLNISFSTK